VAISEIYVDPAIAGDSGAGTIGDPYGDLEFAIEQETFDLTNGTRVNIKAGTDEVLVAKIDTAMADTSVSIAWAPIEAAPLIIQGYTSAAGDLGIGGISGGGSVPIFDSSTLDHINLIDLHLHNTGVTDIVQLDDNCSAIRCEFDNTTQYGIQFDDSCLIADCYFHNLASVTGRYGCRGDNLSIIRNNYIEISGEGEGIFLVGGHAFRNIVKFTGTNTNTGISIITGSATHNSIYSAGGDGIGIDILANSAVIAVENNLIEGFSASGGQAIDTNTGASTKSYGGNSEFNCDAGFGTPLHDYAQLGDNETLSASPFRDATNDDFTPLNVGNVLYGALPQGFHANAPANIIRLNKGAIQLLPNRQSPREWRHNV